MKAKRKVVTFDEKRRAVYNFHVNMDKQLLASKCIALMYNKDILEEYRELPTNYKVK
jgi:hypothetical protein